jgi:hypothetical protein
MRGRGIFHFPLLVGGSRGKGNQLYPYKEKAYTKQIGHSGKEYSKNQLINTTTLVSF